MLPFRTTVEPVFSALPPLRHSLDAWLEDCGMGEPQRSEIVLATHEAVANAIEHAGVAGPIMVSADARPDAFAVEVSDDGHWRPPRASLDRGRGLMLVHGLVSEAQIETGEHGTTVHLCQRHP